jgi:ABC-type antimicrobial peptide transport system permease subunit
VLRANVTGLDLDSPMVFVLVAVTLAVIAVAAAAVPGLHAARVDPLAALRTE